MMKCMLVVAQELQPLFGFTYQQLSWLVDVQRLHWYGNNITFSKKFSRNRKNTCVCSLYQSDEVWMANVQKLMDMTGDTPLGLYETPVPKVR